MTDIWIKAGSKWIRSSEVRAIVAADGKVELITDGLFAWRPKIDPKDGQTAEEAAEALVGQILTHESRESAIRNGGRVRANSPIGR